MFIIIWGFRARWSRRKNDTGTFFCQNCGGDRSWVKVVLRRWFTLFFIPLIPGKVREEAIECQTCSKKWKMSVLAKPTSADLSTQLQGSCRLAAVAVLRSGDPSNTAARAAAVEAVQRTGAADYTGESLTHDLASLDIAPLDEHLGFIAAGLETAGKELFLGSVARIAAVGGFAAAAQPALLHIGATLGLTPAHATGVITTSATLVLPPPPVLSAPSAPLPPPPGDTIAPPEPGTATS